MDHHGRSYHEKCSTILNRRSPPKQDVNNDPDAEVQDALDADTELKKRSNLFYSDLFGRQTPMEAPKSLEVRHPRHQAPAEDQIIVHQDWTNSKTELMGGVRGPNSMTPAERKISELHTSSIFGEGLHESAKGVKPMTTDNSWKTRGAVGLPTQQIHQAHLKSSMAGDDFYETASTTKAWEVVELYLGGLPADADERSVKRLCQGCDLQIVKVSVELDPARNICKGRAKIMVRYNPQRDSLDTLVRRLEEANLIVQC